MSEAHSQRNPIPGVDREKLDAVIDPVVQAHGAEVVDLELKTDRNGWILRVYVEKLGASAEKLSTEQAAVDLDLCSGIAKDLSPALDVVDVIPHTYNLEISSPGVERPLRGERDYIRFAGKKAKLKLANPVRGQKVLVGVLGDVRGGKLAVKDGGAEYDIPLGDIESGRLVFEFGPASRDGKPGKPGKPGSKSSKSNKKKSH